MEANSNLTMRATLTLKDSFISKSCIEIKIELNFYFRTSLWCLERFGPLRVNKFNW